MSANADNTEQERIASALACIATLQQARQHLNAMPFSASVDEFFRRRDEAIAKILATAGPLSPRAASVLDLFADMACEDLASGGYSCHELLDCYDAGTWKPEAAMAAHEVGAARHEFAEAYRLANNDNVIQFPAKLSA